MPFLRAIHFLSSSHSQIWSFYQKRDIVQFFSDMRPISLSNFLNKVISRVLHDRIEGLLSGIISINQSLLLKGRNITKNVLLAQEIISDIRLRVK